MASQHPHIQHARRARDTHHNGASLRDKGSDILRETFQEFKEHSDDFKKIATEYVQNKPLKSLGIALVAGMALALFLKR